MNSSTKDKILILSASYGEGHKQVARAISEAVEYTLHDVEPVIIDIMEYMHPYLYPISHYLYKNGIKKFPQVYSFLYNKTRAKNSFSTKLNSLFAVGMHSILEVIQREKPLVVVSTYPFAAGIISKLKEQRFIDIPAVTIMTDYTDHSSWIHSFTDQYVVGCEQVRDRLISLGVDGFKIKVTGIPVRKRFREEHSRELLLKKYRINPLRFTILIMGGGDGLIGKGMSTFQALESIPTTLQLIIVCGRNNRLRKQLEQELKTSKHDILLLGFCEHIQELMAIANLMITKPGGVTSSEALAMELPLLIYHPLPGQEEDNANYLIQLGLALRAETASELIINIQNVIQDMKPLKRMQQRIRQYQTKNASMDALEAILLAVNHGKAQKMGLA